MNGDDSQGKAVLRDEIAIKFDRLMARLAEVPGVTSSMLAFNGTAEDFERLGYFFYEGVLPGEYGNCLSVAKHVLARVLIESRGFEWQGDRVTHPELGIECDLDSFRVDALADRDAYDVIVECFAAIEKQIIRRKQSS